MGVSTPTEPSAANIKNFWYLIKFFTDLKDDTMVPFDCFDKLHGLFFMGNMAE